MQYIGTNDVEMIWIAPEEDEEDQHYIELIKACDEPIFYVRSCCDPSWIYKFYMDGVSNYEMVKHTIVDAAFECDNMTELMDYLDDVFVENFDDIIVYDECDGCCGECGCGN